MTDFIATSPAFARAPAGITPMNRPDPQDMPLYKAAQKLESQFLAQMLTAAGFGEARESFGGGQGESQFTSFLVSEYADTMAEQGGIGLAEMIFKSLKDRQDAAGISG